MITEDYVSFEIAKLLKEKGFDEKCRTYYKVFPEDKIAAIYHSSENRGVSEDDPNEILCPTFQMVMKWLRERPKIAYNIFIYADGGDSGSLGYMYEIQEIDNELMHVKGSLDTDNSRYEFYEEACEAAIKYCIEHLI